MIDRTFSARLDCHYLVSPPARIDEQTPLVVTLHGFGANPETMLTLTRRLFTTEPVIVSMQGPYSFFLDKTARDVGYGWITSRHPAESIRLHHDMLLHVLAETGREFGIPPGRTVLAGFSQPVSLNYRFAATHPATIGGVIAVCGGLPSDWETGKYNAVTAGILHIARREDEYYPPAATALYESRLRLRARSVEFHMLDGGHHMPSGARPIVDTWLDRRGLANGRP
jgi:phospholipase/carboxylesterase